MRKEVVEKILSETEAGYDLIADKFSQTRKHFWRGLEWLGDYAQDGDRILDFGCGNGRLLELLNGKKISYVGADVSQKLIDIASHKYGGAGADFQKISSQGSLPFQDDSFNTVYSIAVFHHLPSRELRSDVAKEICRVSRPGGYAIITVWNLWQPRYVKYILRNWTDKLLGRSDLDWNDCYISFTDNQGKVFQRYHHAFTARELKRLFREAGFEIERCERVGGRNLVLVGRKPCGKLPS